MAISRTIRTSPFALTIARCALVAAFAGATHGAATHPVAAQVAGHHTWRNAAIVGGGFVPGLEFHPAAPGLLYARTDVGGAYRYLPDEDRWLPLNDSIGRSHWQWAGIASLAIDPTDPDRVYLAAGSYPQVWGQPGALLRSVDRGATWEAVPLPFKLPGNWDGRNTGERLLVQPDAPEVLWLGTAGDGLWRSGDRGSTWAPVAGLPATGITTVWAIPSGEGRPATLMVAFDSRDAAPIWRSADGGESWQSVPGQPRGMLVHQAGVDARGDLYVAYGNALGPNGVTEGALWKLSTTRGEWTNLTPAFAKDSATAPFGFAGIAADPLAPGSLLVSSLCRWKDGDQIWRTTDGGATWRSCFDGATWDHEGVAYAALLKPHWISDIAIDPGDGRRAWFVTGYGLWTTDDIAPADGRAPHWRFANAGLEETVAEELVSPPRGAPLLSALGDIGGFRHDTLDTSPAGGPLQPHRGSSTSIAFAALAPERFVRTHHGEARAALSDDGGLTWRDAIATPPAAREHGPGSLVLNADASRLIWLPKGGPVHVSTDAGGSWSATTPDYTAPRNHLTARLAADAVDPLLVYLCDPVDGRFMASEDGGVTFALSQMFAPEGGIIRAEPRQRGAVWVPTSDGLYVSTRAGRDFVKLAAVSAAYQVGFGKAAPASKRDTVFLHGRIGEAEGIFRSDDSGSTWIRIDDPSRRYGWLRAVVGDGQVHGRVYLGTSGRGVIVGGPAGN